MLRGCCKVLYVVRACVGALNNLFGGKKSAIEIDSSIWREEIHASAGSEQRSTARQIQSKLTEFVCPCRG